MADPDRDRSPLRDEVALHQHLAFADLAETVDIGPILPSMELTFPTICCIVGVGLLLR